MVSMKVTEAIGYFDSASDLAKKLGVRPSAVSNWRKRGDLVPELAARQLHELTRGRLRFDPEVYRARS